MSTIRKHWGIGFWTTILILLVASIWALQSGYFPTSTAFASQEENSSTVSKKEAPQPNPARREVVEKRTETSQTFDNGDGTFTAEIYAGPIHYQDNSGNFKPINTRVIHAPTIPQAALAALASNPSVAFDSYDYSAEENSIRAYFKEKANEGNMFRAEVGDHFISWQPQSMSWVYPDGTKETIATVQGITSTHQDNKVSYYDLFPDVDEEFEVLPGRIKDRVIFYSPPPSSETNPENLIVEGILNVDPSLSFYVNGVNQTGDFSTSLPIELRNRKNEIVMVLDAPVSFEYGDPHQSISSAYSISSSSGQIYLSISAPSTWLLDPLRNYPIIIDPTTVIIYPTEDTWIRSGNSVPQGSTNMMYVSSVQVACLAFRDLSSIPSGATIDTARLGMWEDGFTSGPTVTCYRIQNTNNGCSWTEENLVYGSGITFYVSPTTSRVVTISALNWWYNMASWVSNWKSGGWANCGIMCYDANGTAPANDTVFHTKEESSTYSPRLEVVYTVPCSPGPCCDGTNYRPSSYVCSTTTEYGCPWGTACGNDVGSRTVTQYCSGSSSSCNGSVSYGSYGMFDDCLPTEYCTAGDSTCNTPCGSPCTYTMTSPNDGSENWLVGSVHNITWTSSGSCSASVNLRFYDGSSGSSKTCCWSYIVTGTANDGVYAWTIPNTPPTNWAIVEVQDSADPSIWDWNDYYFTISSVGPVCGNGMCESGETDLNCPQDCGCQASGCDVQAPYGCYCDSACVSSGDCCSDACLVCGYCVVCSPGPCCDGVNYRPSSYSCSTTTEYGCPWGTACGNDVGSRAVTQYCSGSSSSCSGSVSYGSYGLFDDCTSCETCAAGDSTCNNTPSCPGCSPCTPNCTGQQCGGDDGCGGTCQTGTCPAGESCTSGKCVASGSSSDGGGGGCGSCAIAPQELSPEASALYDMIYMLPYLSLLAFRILRPKRRKK